MSRQTVYFPIVLALCLGASVQGDDRLTVALAADQIDMNFDLGRGDGIFQEETGMPIAVVIRSKSPKPVIGKVHWLIKNDEGKELANESVDAVLPAADKKSFACPFAPATAGFYRATCTFKPGDNSAAITKSMTLGYQPQKIKFTSTGQKDFDAYWQETMKSLAAVKPQFKLTRKASMDSKTHQVYEVEMISLGGVRVRGWYEKPLAEGKHPALLRVPGYTGRMRPTASADPIAFFSFNIRGHGNSQDDVSGKPANFWVRGLDDKQGYFYQGAYADCVRAVDFLASRPEVDLKRVAVTGGSQGGGLSLAVAGLDRRISFCAPDIAFLCDWVKYFKTTDWPEMNKWVAAEPDRSWEKTLATMSYFDTMNFADRIRCPTFFGIGLQDGVCPPATIFAVYNRLPGKKEYRVYPHARHWVDKSHHGERRKWLLKQFGLTP